MNERRPIIEVSSEAVFALGIAIAVLTLISLTAWYNLTELAVKREALARGTPALEVQCIFPESGNSAACLVLLGAKK
jgi:hypothetical protein